MRKTNRLTARQLQFLEAYKKTGGNVPQTAQLMGVSVSLAYHLRANEKVKRELSLIVEKTRERIREGTEKYLNTLHELLDDKQTPSGVRASIAQDLLDRAGLLPPKTPTVQVNINTSINERARNIVAMRLEQDTIEVEAVESKD